MNYTLKKFNYNLIKLAIKILPKIFCHAAKILNSSFQRVYSLDKMPSPMKKEKEKIKISSNESGI